MTGDTHGDTRGAGAWKTFQAIENAHRMVIPFRDHPDYAASNALTTRFRALLDTL